MSKADEYVRERMKGAGTCAAATAAGYRHGVPGPMGRELWCIAEIAMEEPEMCAAAREEMCRVEVAIAKLQARRLGLARWVRVGELVAG